MGNTLDDRAEFQRLTEQSLSIKRELGERQGIAKSLDNLADLYINRGELVTGRRLLEEALELFWQLGRKRMVAVTLIEFGKLVMAEGQPGRCLQLTGAAETLLSALNFPVSSLGLSCGADVARARLVSGR